jgi:transcriptional regulator with XRE-family HTH domain
MKFHERLKILRLSSALMQKELAHILGVSVRTFQGWETGRSEPSIEKLLLLADLFNVSLDDLLCHQVREAGVVEHQKGLPTYPKG